MSGKKIGITGHTNGLGKAIHDRYQPNVVGFSRRNGFDISIKEDRKRIIESSMDLDIFINNAYSDMHQVDLLYEIFDAWKDRDAIILNISSNSSDGIKKMRHPYAVYKSALDKASEQLSRLSNNCRVFNIRPGYMDTPRVAHVMDEPKIGMVQMLSVVDFMVNAHPDVDALNITILPRTKLS